MHTVDSLFQKSHYTDSGPTLYTVVLSIAGAPIKTIYNKLAVSDYCAELWQNFIILLLRGDNNWWPSVIAGRRSDTL